MELSGKLGSFILGKVGDRAAAEDIRQDVFLRLQKRLLRSGSVEDMEAWLYRSARNAVIDHFRKRKQTVEIPETLAAEFDEKPHEAEGLRAAFRRMIASLPEPYRDAVVLADIQGLKQREVAERLGISLSGAKSRVQRGREQLRTMLHECCTFEFDRRRRVIDCAPRSAGGCEECG